MTTGIDPSTLFDPEFLGKLRALFLRLRKRRQLKKKGMQSTPATGFTREFKDFRHYTPNDDYRAIDWRLYARLDRLYIRLYEEVQEFHVHVLVDTSASMAEPYSDKRVAALKMAVALSYLGLAGQHRVTLYTMADQVTTAMPPLKGQGNIQKIVERLSAVEFSGTTDLERCFRDFRPSRSRFGIIFLVSDLFGRNPDTASDALGNIASWPGETHIIHTYHEKEREPDLDGEIELVDVETQEKRKMWLMRRERQRYTATFDTFLERVHRGCLARQIDYLGWKTDESFEDTFLELLSQGSALAGSV